ncbi:outer membrane protein assembly factor BamB family protein [Streptomyces triculaminicus]|uniref:outer membrane protein assembly factor BamB family protein n=1 Tax=Streptomyces triculaminicus TaxID=2816232 RepID=UPI00379014F0
MKVRKIIALSTVAITLTMLTACSGGDGGVPDMPGGSDEAKLNASPAPKGFTAPTKFSPDPVIALPDSATQGKVYIGGDLPPPPIALHQGTVFISRPDGLDVVSSYGKSFPATITPEHSPVLRLESTGGGFVGNNPAHAPLITSFGGKTWVLSAVVAEVTGSGTTKSHDVVELMAVDTANTRTKAWFTETKVTVEDRYSRDRGEAHVVGRGGNTVVILSRGQLFGVDLTSRRHLWTAQGTYDEGAVVIGDRVIALRDRPEGGDQVVGISTADGKDLWTSPRAARDELSVAGPDTVMTYEKAEQQGGDRHHLLNAATGEIQAILPKDAPSSGCTYDGAAVTVCTDGRGSDRKIAAYNPKNGQEVWRLPDAAGTRVAPSINLVRAGLIYGMANGNPVVLDAASGKDKENQPGVAPHLTDGYVGITETKDGRGLSAYRAVG